MQLAAPSRRALGLTAVGAIAMSTTVLSVGGVAQAAPAWSFSYSAADGAYSTQTVPAGYCGITWTVIGAQGGTGVLGDGTAGAAGAFGGRLVITTEVQENDSFTLYPGGAGGNAAVGNDGGAGGQSFSGGTYYDGQTGAVDGLGSGGGGGGAGSVVMGSGVDEDGPYTYSYLSAFGGDGSDGDVTADGGAGGYGDGANQNEIQADIYGANPNAYNGVGSTAGGGSISGVGVECPPPPTLAAPDAPEDLWVLGHDGGLDISFAPAWFDADETSPVTGWQVSTDDGANWATLTTAPNPQDAEELIGTVNGLTNGTTYQVKVRATSAVGPGAETDAMPAMAYKPIGAPTNVVATKGPSSIVITWDAPTTGGTFPLAGYVVAGHAESVTGDGGSGIACETAADVRRCVMVAEPGWTHTFGVTPVDSAGNAGLHSVDVTVSGVALSAVPTAVPAKNGDLVRPAGQSGSVAPGATVRVTGGGYLPGSTVTLVVYSEPQVLTTTVADTNGNIDVTVTVPAGLAAGNHTLVAAGVDAQGNTHYLTLPITVTGGTTGAGGLAYTGASIALPALGGLIALTAGGGLLFAARRRSAA